MYTNLLIVHNEIKSDQLEWLKSDLETLGWWKHVLGLKVTEIKTWHGSKVLNQSLKLVEWVWMTLSKSYEVVIWHGPDMTEIKYEMVQ